MADITSVDLARRAGENLEQASPDLLRAMVQTFVEALMGAEADALCGAPYEQVSAERVNCRNGYRQWRWDTRAGTIGHGARLPLVEEGEQDPGGVVEQRRAAWLAGGAAGAAFALLAVALLGAGCLKWGQRRAQAREFGAGHPVGRSSPSVRSICWRRQAGLER